MSADTDPIRNRSEDDAAEANSKKMKASRKTKKQPKQADVAGWRKTLNGESQVLDEVWIRMAIDSCNRNSNSKHWNLYRDQLIRM